MDFSGLAVFLRALIRSPNISVIYKQKPEALD